MFNQQCILTKGKVCNNCQECMVCDLNPQKKCDNCCQCLDNKQKDYETILIDEIIME